MQRRKLIKALTLSSAVAAMGLSWTIQAAETKWTPSATCCAPARMPSTAC